MRLQLLQVPGCPNVTLLRERLDEVLNDTGNTGDTVAEGRVSGAPSVPQLRQVLFGHHTTETEAADHPA